MRARAAEIEPRQRHAVIRVAEDGPRGKELIERQRAVEDIAVRQTEGALQIEWRENLAADHTRAEAGSELIHGIDHEVGDFVAMSVPRFAIGQLRSDVLAEQARHVRALRREAVVEGRWDEHLD